MNNNKQLQYVFVTGGIGFIGSHVVIKLIENNFNIIILDNLSNSNINIIDKIKKITEHCLLKNELIFIKGDIRDKNQLNTIFSSYNILYVMHFAALKSVNESQKYPELYYDVNVKGTKNLLEIMKDYNCNKFIYSSSATVYGDAVAPVTEISNAGINLSCNYARNKYEVERFIIDNYGEKKIFDDWNIVILRYFNPIGAHPSGELGENPNDIPNNIFPYLLRVAKWTNNTNDAYNNIENPYKIFTVFGNDYTTRDKTCIRDYIHVQDLARAHVEVLAKLNNNNNNSISIYNVGTGKGSSVLELIDTLNEILIQKNNKPINYKIGPRREGDIDISYAKVDKIYNEIGFKTEFNLYKMCIDGLNFIGI